MILRTQYQRDRDSRDRRIYEEYMSLSSEPGAAATEVVKFLMRKYGIHSPSTIWAIRKRVGGSVAKGGSL